MASSSSVLQDESWLSRADRALLPVERIFALIQRIGRIFTSCFSRPTLFQAASFSTSP